MSSSYRAVSAVSLIAFGLALASGCSSNAAPEGEDLATAASALSRDPIDPPEPTDPPPPRDPITKPPVVATTPASVTGVLSQLTVGQLRSTGAGGGVRFLVRKADKKLQAVVLPASVIANAGGLSRILGKRVVVNGNLLSSGVISATSVTRDASFVDPGNTLPPVTQVGAKKWLTIPCRFSEVPNPDPHGPDYFRGLMGAAAPGAGDYWAKASNGRLSIDGSNVLDWQDMPLPQSFYAQLDPASRVGALVGDCVTAGYFAAKTADPFFDFQTVDGLALAFSHNLEEQLFGGPLSLELDGPSKFYALSVLSPNEFANQASVNRTMGLGMNLTLSGSAPLHFDSPWDVMSFGYGTTNGVTCRSLTSSFGCASVLPAEEHALTHGWIDPSAVATVAPGATATVQLDFAGNAPLSGHSSLIHLPVDATHYYTIEARKQAAGTYDSAIPNTDLLVHSMDTTQYDAPSEQQALDATTRLRLVKALNGATTYDDVGRGMKLTVTPQAYGYSVNIVRGYNLRINSTGGSGSISGTVSCGSTPCTRAVAFNTTASFSATPPDGYTLVGYSGCDSITNKQCNVNMTGARTVSVVFKAPPQPCTCLPTWTVLKCEQICGSDYVP
jgi:Divergent InlB B-repeat domain